MTSKCSHRAAMLRRSSAAPQNLENLRSLILCRAIDCKSNDNEVQTVDVLCIIIHVRSVFLAFVEVISFRIPF